MINAPSPSDYKKSFDFAIFLHQKLVQLLLRYCMHPRYSQGVICLDIDGTITDCPHTLNERVVDKLNDLYKQGWDIIFITGRPFEWTEKALRPLDFPYELAVQNGVALLKMPSRQVVMTHYLSEHHLIGIEAIAKRLGIDFIIYTGIETQGQCYYLNSFVPKTLLNYGLRRADWLGEKWIGLTSFSEMPPSNIASFKFFAEEPTALSLSQAIEVELGLNAPPNRDPYKKELFVIQATHPLANKGESLRAFLKTKHLNSPVIAAGDDYNDQSMLEAADVRIVMANAPAPLHLFADIIASSAEHLGIIHGLDQAIGFIPIKKKRQTDLISQF